MVTTFIIMTNLNCSYFALSLLIALVSGLCNADKFTYEGFTLYRCEPQTEDQVNQLRLLMESKVTMKLDKFQIEF